MEIVPTFLGAHEVPDDHRDRREDYVAPHGNDDPGGRVRGASARFCDVFCDRGVHRRGVAPDPRGRPRARASTKLHADELADVGAAALAAEVGAISADHLLHANDRGLRAMAEAGVIAVLLPGTALPLGLPYARARDMIAMGLPVAIATDFNPGSTFCSSMPLMLTLAVTQMRLTPAEAWMAAANGRAWGKGAGWGASCRGGRPISRSSTRPTTGIFLTLRPQPRAGDGEAGTGGAPPRADPSNCR